VLQELLGTQALCRDCCDNKHCKSMSKRTVHPLHSCALQLMMLQASGPIDPHVSSGLVSCIRSLHHLVLLLLWKRDDPLALLACGLQFHCILGRNIFLACAPGLAVPLPRARAMLWHTLSNVATAAGHHDSTLLSTCR
jgi:hypothetical protein